MRLATFGGGAARGAVQVTAARALVGTVDEVHGTSVGSLTAACVAAGRVGLLDSTWRGMRSLWGLLRPAWPWQGGLSTLAPVRRLVAEHLHPRDLTVPCWAHVVDLGTEQPVAIALHELQTADELAAALVASCTQTGLHVPAWWQGRPVTDGGARYTVPVPYADPGDEIVAVACSALQRPWLDSPTPPSALLGWAACPRALSVLYGHSSRASARLLRAAADRGVRVVLCEPPEYPGDPWDASAETLTWRLDALGPAAWEGRHALA